MEGFMTTTQYQNFVTVAECRSITLAAKELLIAPLWSRDKKRVLNGLHKRMKLENAYQGIKERMGTIIKNS